MKVKCPVCGVQGILERRGNSSRVVHYRWEGGKHVFTRHTVKGDGNSSMGTMGTGGKGLGTDKPDYALSGQNESRGWELNPYRAALQAAASTVQPPRQASLQN